MNLVSCNRYGLLMGCRVRVGLAGWLAAVVVAALGPGCAGPNGGALTSGPNTTTSALALRDGDKTVARTAAATDAQARKTQSVKVGLLLPLSGAGQTGLIAENMKKAAELALVELNAPHLDLLVRDDKATPEGAEAAARDVLAQGAEIILGPLFARSVQSATMVARSANVPIVAFSNDKQLAGQGVSLLSFLAEPEVHRVVAFAAAHKKRRFIALVPDDAYGRGVESAFRSAVGRIGGQVVALEVYPAQPNGMLEAVRKLRDAVRGLEEHGDPVDALFLPGGEDSLAILSPQLRQAQFDLQRIKIIGTGALDYPNAGRDPQMLGAWFAAPDPRGWQDFSAKYARTYGHAPPRIASLAYDAVSLAAALSNGPDGARYIPSQLTRASGFNGADGQFRLSADGTTERSLAVLEVQQFAARVIDPAPMTAGLGLSDRRLNTVEALKAPSGTSELSKIPSAFPVN